MQFYVGQFGVERVLLAASSVVGVKTVNGIEVPDGTVPVMRAAEPIPAHRLADLLPPMDDAEFLALVQDLDANGQADDIVLFEGLVLDGRHRQRALFGLGRLPRYAELPAGTDPLRYIYSKALHRNLDGSQKAVTAALLTEEFAESAKARMLAGTHPMEGVPQGPTRELAGNLFGVSGRYVQDAILVRAKNPDLFQSVFNGSLKLTQAVREVKRAERKAAVIERHGGTLPIAGAFPWAIEHGDCLDVLEAMERRSAKLIFTDPPYNQGIDYGNGAKADQRPYEDYLAWCRQWIGACVEVLAPDGSLWVMIRHEYGRVYEEMLLAAGLEIRSWITWYETFGINCSDRFNRTSRRIFYCARPNSKPVFNAEAFNRPSARQVLYNDGRAAAGGKLWDDVWAIPRLPENSAEHMPGFPTQLPLALVRPIVLGCSDPGDLVVDPFSGSGTTCVAAVTKGRAFRGSEINADYARESRTRVNAALQEAAAARVEAKEAERKAG